MQKKLDNFKCEVKEKICQTLTDIYKAHNGGLLPKWEEDEEIVVEDSELGNREIRIGVCVDSMGGEETIIEKWVIHEYRVTLFYNLVFWCGDNYDEFDWTSLTTDELVMIYEYLQKCLANINS